MRTKSTTIHRIHRCATCGEDIRWDNTYGWTHLELVDDHPAEPEEDDPPAPRGSDGHNAPNRPAYGFGE